MAATKPLLELLSLSFLSLLCTARAVLGMYAWWGDGVKVGLKADLRTTLDTPDIDVSIKRWGNAVWILIFVWEVIWTAYAWSCLCRNVAIRSIFPGIYPLYTFACVLNIGWIFAEGNNIAPLSLALSALLCLVLYISLGSATIYLYRKRFDLKIYDQIKDLRAAHVLVLNGVALFAAWTTITMLYDLGAVLQENAHVYPATVATIILSLLGSLVVSYFLLELTILDRFLRYVIIVYPVVIWTLAAVLVRHWDIDDRNVLFSLVLLCVVVLLFLLRVCLVAVFRIFRPIPDFQSWSNGTDFVPY